MKLLSLISCAVCFHPGAGERAHDSHRRRRPRLSGFNSTNDFRRSRGARGAHLCGAKNLTSGCRPPPQRSMYAHIRQMKQTMWENGCERPAAGEVASGSQKGCAGREGCLEVRHERDDKWVSFQPDYVFKCTGIARGHWEYVRERDYTQRLGKYPHFISLLDADDECNTVYIERLNPHNWRRAELNATLITRQMDYIFSVLELEQLTPSVEMTRGFGQNIFIDAEQQMTVFDFGQYKRFHSRTLNDRIKEAILDNILLGRDIGAQARQDLAKLGHL